jgi:hypothetical protein
MMDQMLMAISMARATYIKKIALDPGDVTPSLSMGVTMEHILSVSMPVLGGVIWVKYGYEYVFIFAAGIALINLISALFMRVPAKQAPALESSGQRRGVNGRLPSKLRPDSSKDHR